MTHPKIIAEPSPDEIKEAAQRLNERFQDLTADDARMYATTVMLGDKRVDRMVLEMIRRDAQIKLLMAEVREWLCPGCDTVYPELPGPSDNALTRFRCPTPGCNSNVGLRNTIRLRKEREERRAERLAYETEMGAYKQVAEQASRALGAIATRERAFLIEVAAMSHEEHRYQSPEEQGLAGRVMPKDWKECPMPSCKALQEATYDRETVEEQQRAKDAYERVIRGS